MHAGLDAETPSRQRQFVVTRKIGLHHGRVRPARMQVDGHIEPFGAFENAPELLLIQKTVSGTAIDHRALEAEPADRTIELPHCRRRVRGWQCGEAGEAIGMRFGCRVEAVVDLSRGVDRRCASEYLAPGLI